MRKKILFIDDEPEFVRPQIIALDDEGYEVTLKAEPDEAIHLLERQHFDLIILDLIMPPRRRNREQALEELDYVETGIKLHREIREELGLVETPIIFLTVVRDQEIRRTIRQYETELGHKFHFLTKPVRSSDLVTEVQTILGDPPSLYLL